MAVAVTPMTTYVETRVATNISTLMATVTTTKKADVEKFFVDKIYSKSAHRPKFDEMMNFLREGNEWIVSEFFRLARSTTDLFNIVDSLTKK